MEENIDLLQETPQPETKPEVEKTEETTPPPVTESPKRKSPIALVVILVLFLLILGASGYFGYENFKASQVNTYEECIKLKKS